MFIGLKKKKNIGRERLQISRAKYTLNIKEKDCGSSCAGAKEGKRLQKNCLPPALYTNLCRASHDTCQ